MKHAYLAGILAVVGSAADAQQAQVDGCRIVQAGIYATDSATPATRDSNGVLSHNDFSVPHLALATTEIPLKSGVNFGIEYTLTGHPDGAGVSIRDELHYPAPGARPPGSTGPLLVAPTTDNASINRGFYSFYTLEEPWELLPGKWEFQLWLGDRELCSQEFTLVKG